MATNGTKKTTKFKTHKNTEPTNSCENFVENFVRYDTYPCQKLKQYSFDRRYKLLSSAHSASCRLDC
jgi:hypothetical protein